MWLLPWRHHESQEPVKEPDVVYVCREVQQVGYKLEGSLNRLEDLITMISERGKVAADKSSLPTNAEAQ